MKFLIHRTTDRGDINVGEPYPKPHEKATLETFRHLISETGTVDLWVVDLCTVEDLLELGQTVVTPNREHIYILDLKYPVVEIYDQYRE